MSNTPDPLAAFRRKGQDGPASTVKPSTNKQPYEAFRIASEGRRYLEFRSKFPDPAEAFSYAAIRNIQTEWRMGQDVALDFADPRMFVVIKGKNLGGLSKAIQAWQVEWIAEFDPQEHSEPSDKSAPFIQSITFHTQRSEEAPPANQRH